MTLLASLSPVPAFPAYSGPYKVGSRGIELACSSLESETATPPTPDERITTVQFRLYYPCKEGPSNAGKQPSWLPEPQGKYLRAYYRFCQASPWLASLLSHVPLLNLIQYTKIPAIANAELESPAVANKNRWPVVYFSHGLGGTSRMYSYILGSLASHGLVVVAPDHRDGSAPLAKISKTQDAAAREVGYWNLPHTLSPEVEAGRNQQLKVRMWELALTHQAVLQLDAGRDVQDLTQGGATTTSSISFKNALDVHAPGRITWSGHSFGAATTVQFVKSFYYGDNSLLAIPQSSSLSKQIKPSTPVLLLDLWGMPLTFSSTSSLRSRPLPAYSSSDKHTSHPSRPLAILSEGFYNWKSNLDMTLEAVSPSEDSTSTVKPFIFYPLGAAHLSQSDVGILFPWITSKFTTAKEPQRALRLNMRAMLEALRLSRIPVSDTSQLDMEIVQEHEGKDVPYLNNESNFSKKGLAMGQDHQILAEDGSVRGWIAVDPQKIAASAATQTKEKSTSRGGLARDEIQDDVVKPAMSNNQLEKALARDSAAVKA